MTTERVDLHLEGVEGAELRGFGTRGRVAKITGNGAVSVDVAGRDAIELTLDGDGTIGSWSGWHTSTDVFQGPITVTVKQDATGAHLFDWRQVDGDWLETPPEPEVLDSAPGDTSLIFRAWTQDAGSTVTLEAIGVQYDTDCIWADGAEVDIPEVLAGGSTVVGHNLSIVTSVGLVRLSDGKHIVPEWYRTNFADPASPIRIDFTDAAPAGTWVALVTGKGAAACELSVVATAWESLTFQANTAANLNFRIDHDSGATDVEWVWGDGNTTNPTNATNDVYTYNAGTYPAGYTGPVVLRWRKGTRITRIDTRFDNDLTLLAATSELPRSLTFLSLTGSGGVSTSNISGPMSALPPNIDRILLNNTQSTMGGTTGGIPRTLTYLNVSNSQSEIVGPASDLPTAMTYLGLGQTNSNLTGQFSDLPRTLLTVTLNETESTIAGITSDLPQPGANPGMVDLRVNDSQTELTGPVSGLPSTLQDLYLTMTPSAIVGTTSDFPAGSREISLGNTGSIISGAASLVPPGTTVFTLTDTPSSVTWLTSFTPPFTRNISLDYGAGGTPLTTAQVDLALNDINAAGLTPAPPRLIGLGGPINEPRTVDAPTDAVVLSLQTASWIVSTN